MFCQFSNQIKKTQKTPETISHDKYLNVEGMHLIAE